MDVELARQNLELQGFNPVLSIQRAIQQDQRIAEELRTFKSAEIKSKTVQESIDFYESLHEKWSALDTERENLHNELTQLKSMLISSERLTSSSLTHAQALRWENRELSQLEVRISSAQCTSKFFMIGSAQF